MYLDRVLSELYCSKVQPDGYQIMIGTIMDKIARAKGLVVR